MFYLLIIDREIVLGKWQVGMGTLRIFFVGLISMALASIAFSESTSQLSANSGKPESRSFLSVLTADTLFEAVDLGHATIAPDKIAPMGIDPSPFIVWKSQLVLHYGLQAMTLNAQTGAQRGSRLNVTFPEDIIPADIALCRDFSDGAKALGIDPMPFIVFRDFHLYEIPVTYALDGTPVAGTPVLITPGNLSGVAGNAVCMAEIPGSEFVDAKPRLFIGTDQGYIVVLAKIVGAGISVVDYFPALIPAAPITDIQPVPQNGYIAIGALMGNTIYGIRYMVGAPAPHTTVFTLTDPRQTPPTGFDTFGDDHLPLSSPSDSIQLVIANGTSNLALGKFSASQSGSHGLTLKLDTHPHAIKSVITGSLMELSNDATEITFEPDYSQTTGYSGCDVTITDTVSDICGYSCGNANGDGSLNVGDAVFVINYIFKSGPAPSPRQAGDANCDSHNNVGDAVYLINYIFKSGPKPCCP